MAEALTDCEGCGQSTKTYGGRCPVCGYAKAPPALKPPRKWRYESGESWWDWILLPGMPRVAAMGIVVLLGALITVLT